MFPFDFRLSLTLVLTPRTKHLLQNALELYSAGVWVLQLEITKYQIGAAGKHQEAKLQLLLEKE